MKRCFKCGEDKPRTDFYAHPQMGDGLLGKCKSCTKRDVRLDRLAKVEQKRAHERERSKRPHRVARAKVTLTRWRAAHRDRARAQVQAARAMANGIIKRQTACEGCGREDIKLEKHHPDYSKPLLIVWLCKPCHAIADKIRRIQEKSA